MCFQCTCLCNHGTPSKEELNVQAVLIMYFCTQLQLNKKVKECVYVRVCACAIQARSQL
jgi:hypothetical protein